MKFKQIAILITGLLVCSNSNTNYAQTAGFIKPMKPNQFTGGWKINIALSKLGKMPSKFAFNGIEVNQTRDSIKIRRSSEQLIESGEKFTVQTLPLNGNLSLYRSESAKRTKSSFIILNDEGNKMIETATIKYDKVPTNAYQTGYVETWSLGSDGNTLTIEREMKISNERANWSTICVYQKEISK
jgi:hypothetical protein